MSALGIIGFVFAVVSLAQIDQLKKTVESLNKEIEELKKPHLKK